MAAETFLKIVSGKTTVAAATQESTGVSDAGKIVALDDAGKLDETMMPNGIAADTAIVEASEGLSAGDLVNIWNDSGDPKCRKADATSAGKEAVGFVADSVSSGNDAKIFFDGTITGLTSLTPGARYYLSTSAGSLTATPPSGAGNVMQPVGIAKSDSELVFEAGEPIYY